jgi:sulfonate transport system substrate-binding protein
MKKFIQAVLLLAAMTLTITGCGSENAEKTQEPKVIHVGVQQGMIQPFIAEKLGYFTDEFEKDGVKVQLDWFTLGPPMVEAFVANKLDFGFLGDQPVYQGLAQNVDLKIIGVNRTSDTGAGLIVRDDANIKELADLKGKKIAVPFGSNMQPLLELYLEKAGLSHNDVEIINLSFADEVTSLAAGDIQAAVTAEPYLTKAVHKGGITKLIDSKGIKLFTNPLVVRGEFAAQNPEFTVKMLKAFERAAEWAAQHPEEAIDIVAESTKMDKADVKPVYDENKHDILLTPERIEALVTGAQQSYKFGLLKKEVNVKEAIDLSYLERAGLQ